MIFYRQDADKKKLDCDPLLLNLFAGTVPSACWIIGSGPSLRNEPRDVLQKLSHSSAGRFAVNYAGRGEDGEGWLVKPTLQTWFDPTARFSRCTFLDPTIMKFVRAGRERDLIAEGSEKVGDCPNTFFLNSANKSYADFMGTGPINHSLDSLLQAIDIAIRLGFRDLYLIGTEMAIRPSADQIAYARSVGVEYDESTHEVTVWKRDRDRRKSDTRYKSDLLSDLAKMVEQEMVVPEGQDSRRKTLMTQAMTQAGREKQYAFSEQKSFSAACSSDTHYFDRVQYLRLARKSLALQGVRLTSCTPGSRLNAFFPCEPVTTCVDRIDEQFGSADQESTAGRYTTRKVISDLPYHKDIPPYRTDPPVPSKAKPPAKPAQAPQQMPPELPALIEELKSKLAAAAVATPALGGK